MDIAPLPPKKNDNSCLNNILWCINSALMGTTYKLPTAKY